MGYDVFLYRIGLSFFFSLLVGLERQIRGRAIGLRTSVLVSIGTFMFVSFSIQLVSGDISRIAAQVVSGIGFLGAGVILKDGTNIKGLNTAATLWCNAAIGVLCAGGLIVEAAIGTGFILFSNVVLRYITQKIHLTRKKVQIYDDYLLKVTLENESVPEVRDMIMQVSDKNFVSLSDIEIKELDLGKTRIVVKLNVLASKTNIVEILMRGISAMKDVSASSLKKIDQQKVELDDDEI